MDEYTSFTLNPLTRLDLPASAYNSSGLMRNIQAIDRRRTRPFRPAHVSRKLCAPLGGGSLTAIARKAQTGRRRADRRTSEGRSIDGAETRCLDGNPSPRRSDANHPGCCRPRRCGQGHFGRGLLSYEGARTALGGARGRSGAAKSDSCSLAPEVTFNAPPGTQMTSFSMDSSQRGSPSVQPGS